MVAEGSENRNFGPGEPMAKMVRSSIMKVPQASPPSHNCTALGISRIDPEIFSQDLTQCAEI